MKRKRNLSARRLREIIHDELGPRLFRLGTRAALLRKELKGSRQREASMMVEEIQSLREWARNLGRGVEEGAVGDLAQELEELARRIGGEFRNELRRPIRGRQKMGLLLQIAREAAHNAMEHGGASKIVIRLFPGLLRIEDNGAGLRGGRRDGAGMKLMKQRARRLGGELTVQRVARGGTVVACNFV